MNTLKADFTTGFEQGFRAIKGDKVELPILVVEPRLTNLGYTKFQMGLVEGLRAAGITIEENFF